MGGVKRGARGGGEGGDRDGLTATTPARMVVVPQVMVMVEAAPRSTLLLPVTTPRAPVFEYNALYCPRHIIYLAAK